MADDADAVRETVDRIVARARRRVMQGQKTYTVDKAKLINTLKDNRSRHIEEYRANEQSYLKATIAELERKLAAAKAGKPVSLKFNLPKPVLHKKEYDTAIGLLEYAQETVIEITTGDYERYVQDQWEWSGYHKTVSMSYGNAPQDEDDDE